LLKASRGHSLFRVPFILLACSSFILPAQTSSRLHGHVLDPSKRPVPQAEIIVVDQAGKPVFRGTSNASGDFVVSLPTGQYRVSARRDGFDQQQASIALVRQDQQITLSLSLKRETISVTVSDQANKLDTASDSHQDSLKLNASDLTNLPIRDADVLSAISFFANPSGGQSPTIVIDGMERTDSVSLSTAQVREVRLNNNAYSAEFPKPGKDRIEIDTKAGSDDFHGGFSFRTRNSVFDARNPFAATKPPFSRNGYEINLSGPIVKKKVHFFLDADRENQQQVQPILAYLPSGLVNQEVLAPFTRDLLLGRIDWQMSEEHRVSAKYEFHQDQANNVGVGGFVLPEAGATRFHRDLRIELADQYVFSPSTLNSFRLALGTNYESVTSQTDAPSITVPGSFQEGGAQVNNFRKEPRYEFQDNLSWVSGSLTLKTGIEARLHPFQSYSADNFGGTYLFASLAGYETGRPILFTLNTGNPLVVSDQDEYAWFLQAEKQFSRVTLFAGVRHEFQSHFERYANLAPRIAAAVSLDRSRQFVIRLGAGVFYDRRPPTILQQVNRFNGVNTLQYIVENPSFPMAGLTAANLPPPATYQIDPGMTFPRIYQASATVERNLPGGFLATADFAYQRGDHLFRTRNINAPLPVTLNRPDPNLGNVNQIESSASSRGEIFNLTIKSAPKKRYQLFAQYTLSYLRDNTSNVFGPPPPGGMLPPGVTTGNLFSLPANNYDLRPEWGPANNDIRHRFGVAATAELPWKFSLGALTSVHSGLPYDITTGFDNNHDTNPNDRPPGVTRNTGRGARFFNIDLHLARVFSLETKGRKIDCEFAVDSFNLLNYTNPSNFVGVQTSPLFGQPNAAYNGRAMQLSVQLHF
jgi:hypothetical protein